MSPTLMCRMSFGLAALDAVVAVLCAARGDAWFVGFAILAGLMYAQGLYYRAKMEE